MRKAFWGMVFLVVLVFIMAFITKVYFILSGMMLGVIMLLAVGFGYVFIPTWMKRIVVWGPIAFMLDIMLSWGITYGLGYTVTGFTAGLVFGLLLSIVLKFEKLRLTNNLWSNS